MHSARTLTGLSIALLAAGLASAAIGLHPAVSSVLAVRTGVVLLVASVLPAVAVQANRAATVAEERLAEAKLSGYRLALEHVSRGLLAPPPATDGPGHGEPVSHPTRYARGHLRAVAYTEPERRAQ